MAKITSESLFRWENIEISSDMDRLRLVLESIPDRELINTLVQERKDRRNDYPVVALWNSILAGIVFGHESIESLRRELSRNAELRQVCGFEIFGGDIVVPPACVYSRFLAKLFKHHHIIDKMFEDLVDQLEELLPSFGKCLAIDSKAIHTYAKKASGSDKEADVGTKKKLRKRKSDGTTMVEIKNWFGYKLHLIVDSNYELPVSYKVTKASENDSPHLLPMVNKLKHDHPDLVERCNCLSGDKGYDCGNTNRVLTNNYNIKPVIDNRGMWQECQQYGRAINEKVVDTIYYTEKGEVLCRYMNTSDESKNYAPMAFCGYDKSRKSLKYRCPAAAYGMRCHQRGVCNAGKHSGYGRIVRIPLAKDYRIFTPLARSSYGWQREYNKRSAVERVYSRLDLNFGFEKHYIRGMKKMRLRVGLALLVMLSMAVGRIKNDQQEDMRSLIKMVA